MDVLAVLSELTTAPGVSGNEYAAADVAERLFRTFTDDVWRDNLGNVLARIGSGKPTLLVMAHLDEVGMMVEKIEENGMLRIRSVSGVDPRVLPGSRVIVYGRRTIPAVVGAVPPHLLGEERSSAYRMEDLVVDPGLEPAHVEEWISVGDFVTYDQVPPVELKNKLAAGKTLDDRALVAVMLEAMEILKDRVLPCTVVFCASVQEERGSFGATAGSRAVQPDLAIAMDVCQPLNKTEVDRLDLTMGGNIHPKLFKQITDVADKHHLPYEVSACMGHTGTDAWDIQIQCGGIPTGLISVPLRYMHTNVETGSIAVLGDCARLIAEFAAQLGKDWEANLCLDD